MARVRSSSDEVLRREAEWLQLRRDGKSYEQIASGAGVTAQRVHQVVQRARKRAVVEISADMRKDEVARLDMLWIEAVRQLRMDHVLVQHGKIIEGVTDEGAKLAALDRCIRIMERRAKTLGLDEPTKVRVETITTDDLDAKIAQLEAEVAQQSQDASPMS